MSFRVSQCQDPRSAALAHYQFASVLKKLCARAKELPSMTNGQEPEKGVQGN
jgi:hypothetical protein